MPLLLLKIMSCLDKAQSYLLKKFKKCRTRLEKPRSRKGERRDGSGTSKPRTTCLGRPPRVIFIVVFLPFCLELFPK